MWCASSGSKSASSSASNAGSGQTGDTGGATGNSAGASQAGGADTGSGGMIAHGGAPNVDYGNAAVPPAQWTNVTGKLAGMQSECGNMSGVFPSPFSDMLVLGVARQGLWSSSDGGATYTKLGTSGDMISNRLSFVLFDPDDAKVFWSSGIYGWESPFTDGVFKTTDLGVSFSGYKQLSAIQSHNDSVSVDFNDPDRKTMLAGGHEQTGILFRSTDAGATWTDIGHSLPANLGFCTATLVLDAKTLLVGCAAGYSGKSGAVLRSTNGGDAWTQVSDKGVLGEPLWASDGSIYWAGEGGAVYKSSDQGVSFQQVADNNTAGAVRPIELPGGRIVSVAQKVLKGSSDGGKSWQAIGTAMPFDPTVIAYSPFRRAFYASHFDCTNAVPADAIERYGFDFKQ
ncbi:MAG TPA: hypothetical protein VGF76_00600 [Polyangiaceae bacterium]